VVRLENVVKNGDLPERPPLGLRESRYLLMPARADTLPKDAGARQARV
jgi:hypothetical protein